MEKVKTLLNYFFIYLVWVFICAMGLWTAFMIRNSIFNTMMVVYAKDEITRFWVVRALDKFIFIGLGLLWLALVVIIEDYLKNSLEKNDLFKRFAWIGGIEITLFSVLNTYLYTMGGGRLTDFSILLLGGGGTLLGVALIVVYVVLRRKGKKRNNKQSQAVSPI
jgi:hypothetical protein